MWSHTKKNFSPYNILCCELGAGPPLPLMVSCARFSEVTCPRDTYLPISMMFSTGQTIPYLPRRGEHHPNPSAHNPVTILVRYELNTFYLKSNPGSRSSEVRKMHRSWGPLWRVSRRAPLRAPRWAAWRMSRRRPPQRPHQILVVALLLSQNLVVARARAGTFYGVIVDCK